MSWRLGQAISRLLVFTPITGIPNIERLDAACVIRDLAKEVTHAPKAALHRHTGLVWGGNVGVDTP